MFTYSARPGTPAAKHTGQVPVAIARERNAVLREMAAAKKATFMRSLVGTTVEAITLQTGGPDFTEALTENYLKVRIAGRMTANRWMELRVAGVEREALIGEALIGETGIGETRVGETLGEIASGDPAQFSHREAICR